MKSKLVEILEKYCGKMDFFEGDVCLAYKMESIRFIEMITDIEDQFEIEFDMDELREEIIGNPNRLLEIIEKKKND